MPFGGITVKDVCAHSFNRAFSDWLKLSNKIKLPHYMDYVKLARYKELPPTDKDWYYIRAASIARHIYLRKGTGVGAFTKVYGGRHRRGSRPSIHCKAGSSIHRHILQSLEKMNIVEKDPSGGRRLTSEGRKHLDRIAGQVMSDKK